MLARGCQCGKHLFEEINEGTCAWCGHGDARPGLTPTHGRLARLPTDLGALHREGRRLQPVFENLRARAYLQTEAA